jgi:undecaprenyl diphosphate synthase
MGSALDSALPVIVRTRKSGHESRADPRLTGTARRNYYPRVDSLLRHLAVVVDVPSPTPGGGDGLSAEALGPALLESYLLITENAFEISESLLFLSLYCPQTEEWFRADPPAAATADVLRRGLEEIEKAARRRSAALSFLGFVGGLAPPWDRILAPFEYGEATARGVNLFFRYSGREEIAMSLGACLKELPEEELEEEEISSRLFTSGQPDPDLIIYAGGLFEPKDFLIWQASYAEIWHCPKGGLDFGPEDLKEAVGEYSSRQRRFGKV